MKKCIEFHVLELDFEENRKPIEFFDLESGFFVIKIQSVRIILVCTGQSKK